MTPGTPTPGTCSPASPAFSLLTKYVIRYRGSHVFNPSNIGLVVAFVVLGSTRVEPLDFWWAPLNVWMIAAYAVIIGGGLLITRRLHLLGPGGDASGSRWRSASGSSPRSGHCMTTNWAFAPVCGFDFWRVIVTSPEVLIFLFFMITDPKTVPAGRVGRVVFGLLVAVASTLLMAPQTNEFGTKVGLLAGLVVVCAARPLLDRARPRAAIGGRRPRPVRDRLVTGGDAGAGILRGPVRVGLAVAAVLVLGVGIVAAGTPARGLVVPDTAEMLDGVPHQVDPATLPDDHRRRRTSRTGTTRSPGRERSRSSLTLAENLELENQALLRRDESILTAVDHGDRLKEMQGRLQDATATRHDRHRPLPVRRGDDVAARAVRGADGPEPRPRFARHRHRGDLRRRRHPAGSSGRRRSR